MSDQPAARPACEHHYEYRILGGHPINVGICQFCRNPDWKDLAEQAAVLYRWGREEALAGRSPRDHLSAYDMPRDDAPAAKPSVPAADLRDRIAAAIEDVFDRWRDGLGAQRPEDAICDEVLAVLPESRRPFDAQAGLQRLADAVQRRERYAAAVREHFGDLPYAAVLIERCTDAVIAVADAEQSGLRLQMGALAEDLDYVLGWTGPSHAHLAPGRWDKDGSPCLHCARLSLAQERLTAVRRVADQADRVLDERVAAAKEQSSFERSDVGTEFVQQIDNLDVEALAKVEAELVESGVETPGCDCGHDGMGVRWHDTACMWRSGKDEARQADAAGEA